MKERSSANRFTGLCLQEPTQILDTISVSHWITNENLTKKRRPSGRPIVALIRPRSGRKPFFVQP
jgi:hypothetical protein